MIKQIESVDLERSQGMCSCGRTIYKLEFTDHPPSTRHRTGHQWVLAKTEPVAGALMIVFPRPDMPHCCPLRSVYYEYEEII